jgi:hypothetical protein
MSTPTVHIASTPALEASHASPIPRWRQFWTALAAAALMAPSLMPLQAASASAFSFNAGRLPEGPKMVESMCSVQVEARILLMKSAQWSHKVVTFTYPAGSTQRWVWDPQSMSREVAATSPDPLAIATAWASAMAIPEAPTSAEFVASETPNQCGN